MGNRQNLYGQGAYQFSPAGRAFNGAYLLSLIDDAVWQKEPTGVVRTFDITTAANSQSITSVPYGTQYLVTNVFSASAAPGGLIGASLESRIVADPQNLFPFGANSSGGYERFATGDASLTFAPPMRMAVRVNFDAIIIVNADTVNVLRVLFTVATRNARIDLLTIA
jgi:hypothetical protein